MAGTFGWKRTIACIFAVSNFYRELTIPAFFLGVSASEESIKVAEIACSTSQIKMATLRQGSRRRRSEQSFKCIQQPSNSGSIILHLMW